MSTRRRGARKDCDRVSKSEDVNGYKGSMPVDEVLAYVQGAVASTTPRMSAEARSSRSKRKDVVYNMQRARKVVQNTDSEMNQDDDRQEIGRQDPAIRGVNGSLRTTHQIAKPTRTIVSLKNLSPPVNDSIISASQHMDAWLSLKMAHHLTMHDDFNDTDLEQKEQEFVKVCKKKKPKSSMTINDVIAKSSLESGRLHDLAHCVRKNGKTFVSAAGDSVIQQVLNGNVVAVSRNSSELSFCHSVESDMDELSPYLDNVSGSTGEILADGPEYWHDAPADTGSYRSSASSYGSVECFEFLDVKNVKQKEYTIDDADLPVRGVPDGDEEVSEFESNQLLDCMRSFNSPSSCIASLNGLSPLSSYVVQNLPDLSPLPDLERAQPAGRCSVGLQAVVFVDSVARSSLPKVCRADTSFMYRCTIKEHLTSGGLCEKFAYPFLNDVCNLVYHEPSAVFELDQSSSECNHTVTGFSIEPRLSDGGLTFTFCELLPQDLQCSSAVELSSCSVPSDLPDSLLPPAALTSATSNFCMHEAQVFLHEGKDSSYTLHYQVKIIFKLCAL